MVEIVDEDHPDDFPRPSNTSRPPRRGTYAYDCQQEDFNMAWSSVDEFNVWLAKEQRDNAVELRRHRTERSEANPPTYTECWIYRCARGGTGGTKAYNRKHPERCSKIGSKRLDEGCPCTLIVKTYPDTPIVKGKYQSEHSHQIGDENLRYTRVPEETRKKVAEMLRMKIDKDHILETMHGGTYSNPGGADDSPATREQFMTMRDIRRIQVAIEAETVRLAPDDGESTRQWAKSLEDEDSLLGFKACDDPAPDGSGLADDTFFFALQTPWQQDAFDEVGEFILCIDGTHNTTMYENCTLFTLITRDKWGHGVPVAFMLSSKKDTPTIAYFLRLFREKNPKMSRYVMTDKDLAQIKAIDMELDGAIILLCWWHVLHAWQQHFHIADHPELWELLKRWIRFTSEEEFNDCWRKIQLIAPKSMVDYLTQYWIPDKAMWSATARVNRGILEDIDTNMLVEAWHHVLKGKFLCGLRNRRCDQLIYTKDGNVTALRVMISKFKPERRAALKRSESIRADDIKSIGDNIFHVKSQSDPSREYAVDLSAWHCSCSYFPCANFCKHIFAVDRFCPRAVTDGRKTVENTLFPTQKATMRSASSSITPATSAALSQVEQTVVSTVDRLSVKMQTLISRTAAVSPCDEVSSLLSALDKTMDLLLEKTATSANRRILPASVSLPPRIRTSTETAKTMPRLQGKRKRGVNAYAGNVGPNKDQPRLVDPDTAIALKVQEKQADPSVPVPDAPTSAPSEPQAAPPAKKSRRQPLRSIENTVPVGAASSSLPKAPPQQPAQPYMFPYPPPAFAPYPHSYYTPYPHPLYNHASHGTPQLPPPFLFPPYPQTPFPPP